MGCCSDKQLLRFLANKLSDRESQQVLAHVGQCAICLHRLDSAADDDHLNRFRRSFQEDGAARAESLEITFRNRLLAISDKVSDSLSGAGDSNGPENSVERLADDGRATKTRQRKSAGAAAFGKVVPIEDSSGLHHPAANESNSSRSTGVDDQLRDGRTVLREGLTTKSLIASCLLGLALAALYFVGVALRHQLETVNPDNSQQIEAPDSAEHDASKS